MSYTVPYHTEVRCDSIGNRRRKADEARENIPDRKQDVPLKWFRINGLRPVFLKSAHSMCVSAGPDATAFKMQPSTTACEKLFVFGCVYP